MQIYLIQKNINDTDFARHLETASALPVDLVCLGELSTSGCLYRLREVDSIESILTSLTKYNFGVLMGFPYRTDKGLFNACLYYRDGVHQVYKKRHLFESMNEHRVYLPGNQRGLFETAFGGIGVAICYDLRFPELFAELKQSGATKVFVPAAFPRVRIAEWRRLLVERARQIKVPVIGINSVGHDGAHEFGGSSMVIDAQGKILAQASEEHEEVLQVAL